MEHAADIDLRRQARVANEDPSVVIRRWLGRGWRDLRAHWGVSLAYGFGFLLLGWMTVLVLALTGLGWMILPAIAGAMLLGPAATVGLYRISRRAQGMGGRGIAAPGQITLVGVVMMTLALLWIRAATLLFAVFFGLRPFAGFLETLHALFFSWEGIALIMIGLQTHAHLGRDRHRACHPLRTDRADRRCHCVPLVGIRDMARLR